MRIRDLKAKERPRERLFSSGAGSLSDAELLAILLGNGSKEESAVELARKLDIQKLHRATPGELCSIRGIGVAKASRIVAAFELCRRLQSENAPQRIKNTEDALNYCRPLIGHFAQEHFLVIFLDVRCKVLGHKIITKGLTDASLIHPREVFREAILHNAHAIVVAHNHPSGDPTPSEEDDEATAALEKTGNTIGIRLLDHVIVTTWQP